MDGPPDLEPTSSHLLTSFSSLKSTLSSTLPLSTSLDFKSIDFVLK